MKKSAVGAVLVLFASACAGGSATSTSDAAPGDTTVATSESTTSIDAGETSSTSGETTTTSDRQLAPDFTLELGDGGTYTLSEGARPVYLVFWAEW